MGETAPIKDNKKRHETEIPVGEVLRRTRVHYNQSIPDIERVLRIRAEQIEAIEQGDLGKLPGFVYAIGFVRSYSEYLGLDGDKMVELFKAQGAEKNKQPALNFPVVASDSKTPSRKILLVSLAAMLVVVALWFGISAGNRKIVENIPPVPAQMKATQVAMSNAESSALSPVSGVKFGPPAPSASQNAGAETAPEEQTIAEKPKQGIILNIVQNSWVEIRDEGGVVLLSRVLQAGDQYFVPDRPDLFISIGNAGGVSIEVDGAPLRPLGKVGDVRRGLRLDAEALKREFAL